MINYSWEKIESQVASLLKILMIAKAWNIICLMSIFELKLMIRSFADQLMRLVWLIKKINWCCLPWLFSHGFCSSFKRGIAVRCYGLVYGNDWGGANPVTGCCVVGHYTCWVTGVSLIALPWLAATSCYTGCENWLCVMNGLWRPLNGCCVVAGFMPVFSKSTDLFVLYAYSNH